VNDNTIVKAMKTALASFRTKPRRNVPFVRYNIFVAVTNVQAAMPAASFWQSFFLASGRASHGHCIPGNPSSSFQQTHQGSAIVCQTQFFVQSRRASSESET